MIVVQRGAGASGGRGSGRAMMVGHESPRARSVVTDVTDVAATTAVTPIQHRGVHR